MNELLQTHGCSNVFSIPDGLKELMSDISREVIREQPSNIVEFITKYLSALIITREHGVMAVKVLNELCDCRPTLSEHLIELGLDGDKAKELANVIREEIEGFKPVDDKDKIKESKILSRILKKMPLDEEVAAQVCELARNAYRDYWYRKNQEIEKQKKPSSLCETAAQHTLAIYKTTRPTMEEMNRAAEKIQAAFKGYYVRKNLHQPKQKEMSPKIYTLPPIVTSGSRTIEFGPIVNIKVQEDNIETLFKEEQNESAKTVCRCSVDDKRHNTPTDTMMSRHSGTQDISESVKNGENDNPAKTVKMIDDKHQNKAVGTKEWKNNFYLEATKKANKDRKELKMPAPPTVLTDDTIAKNYDEDNDQEEADTRQQEIEENGQKPE